MVIVELHDRHPTCHAIVGGSPEMFVAAVAAYYCVFGC